MSIRSSTPKFAKPHGLKSTPGFQKEVLPLLEANPLPVPTSVFLKDGFQGILESSLFFGWIRPAHLRSYWLILKTDCPAILCDSRDSTKLFTARIAVHRNALQRMGSIVAEVLYDPSDQLLYVIDILAMQGQDYWNTSPYTKRWTILQQIFQKVIAADHPLNDMKVFLPEWKSLEEVSKTTHLDKETILELQPDKSGKRRFQYRTPRVGGPTGPPSQLNTKRGPISKSPVYEMIDEEPDVEVKTEVVGKESTPAPVITKVVPTNPVIGTQSAVESVPSKLLTLGTLKKDPRTKLPDTYRLFDLTENDLGYAAIRSLDISRQLRETFKARDAIPVQIQWIESFQKYEVRKIMD